MSEGNEVISDDTIRTSGKLAQRNNITAAKIVAETVRTTLGPKGMDKMLVDQAGEVLVTNDGVTILEEMQIEHPAAKMLVDIAKTQEEAVGDGTTTAVVLAGELLRKAESLLEKNIHPTIIIRGFQSALQYALSSLEQGARPIEEEQGLLKKVAMTAMTGKGAENAREHLASLVVEAVDRVIDRHTSTNDHSAVRLERKTGKIEESELIKGVVLDKEKVHPSMPIRIEDAKIALLNTPLEVKETELDAKLSITDTEQFEQFLTLEEDMIKKKVEQVINTGATVMFSQKGIDDLAQHYLAKQGIYALRRVKASDMEALAKATGAKIITNLEEASAEELGQAGLVEEVKVGQDNMTYVRDCPVPRVVTFLVRGSTEHIAAEVQRAVEDALGVVTAVVRNRKVVPGAGAVEASLANQLNRFSQTLMGKEQLAVQAFAQSLDIIPQTLAENAGLDPTDMLTEIKAAHAQGHEDMGIDVFAGQLLNAWEQSILEPLKIKTQALTSATEVATMLLRIDDVIAAGKQEAINGPSLEQ